MANKELLETIRKEIVSRIDKRHLSEQAKNELVSILSFLSALEKSEKPTLQEPIDKWSNKERKARVKKTGEIVCGFTDGKGHFDIPTDHNEFIRYNLDELEFDTLQGQPVELEEELIAWHKAHFGNEREWTDYSGNYLKHSSQLDLARHFYELGRNVK